MDFPFDVCNICFENYGRNKAKVESLVESKCFRPDRHKSVTVRVRIVDGILEPEIRPMPKVFFRGYFVDCDPDRCRGGRCTFPHCSKEKNAWNAQKFAVAVSSPVTATPPTPRQSAVPVAADEEPKSTYFFSVYIYIGIQNPIVLIVKSFGN